MALTLSDIMCPAYPRPGVNGAILSQIPPRIEYFIAAKTVAGAVTLVATGTEVLEFHALGMADIEANRPMQKDSIVQIMSMTEPVTATGIMILAEEGKLAPRDHDQIIGGAAMVSTLSGH